MTFIDVKQRCSTRGSDYVRYRPSRPSALLELLRGERASCPGRVIAGIGSGMEELDRPYNAQRQAGQVRADYFARIYYRQLQAGA